MVRLRWLATQEAGGFMFIGRLIGWLLLFGAIAAAVYELTGVIGGEGWQPMALGELWYGIDAASLNGAQAGIQRYVAPWLWEPVITTIRLWPVWAAFGVPGLVLAWSCRRRGRSRGLFRNRG